MIPSTAPIAITPKGGSTRFSDSKFPDRFALAGRNYRRIAHNSVVIVRFSPCSLRGLTMSGSLLCIAAGAMLLSSESAEVKMASLKTSPPSVEMLRVKTLAGYALQPWELGVFVQPVSFAQDALNFNPTVAPATTPAIPLIIENKAFGCTDQPGIVFVIGGLGGGDSLATHLRRVFECNCIQHEVCSYGWCHGKRHHLKDLFDHGNVDCHSDELAGQIMAYRAANPGKPIYIMAWSAGVGVALGAAERLPPDSIERVIVMCAACSRSYNLTCALRATRCGIVSFHSPMDHFYLNAVLRCLGTIDRVHGMGAGVYGFAIPGCLSCEDQELYCRRLIQVRWRPHMMFDGHPGGHLWYKSDKFLCAHVVPWLRACASDGIAVHGSPVQGVPSGIITAPESLPAPNPTPLPTTSTLNIPPRVSATPTPAELAAPPQ